MENNDVGSLARQGLVKMTSIADTQHNPTQVVSLTKEGHKFLSCGKVLRPDQTIYHGLKKPKEAIHDAELYRLYHKVADEIEERGDREDAVVSTNDGPLHILRNVTKSANHWLTLELVGRKSNRDAIGAEVKIVTQAGSQLATVSTAGSYLSSSDKRVHFGLGASKRVVKIEMRWPSGIRLTVENIPADQFLRVVEPAK